MRILAILFLFASLILFIPETTVAVDNKEIPLFTEGELKDHFLKARFLWEKEHSSDPLYRIIAVSSFPCTTMDCDVVKKMAVQYLKTLTRTDRLMIENVKTAYPFYYYFNGRWVFQHTQWRVRLIFSEQGGLYRLSVKKRDTQIWEYGWMPDRREKNTTGGKIFLEIFEENYPISLDKYLGIWRARSLQLEDFTWKSETIKTPNRRSQLLRGNSEKLEAMLYFDHAKGFLIIMPSGKVSVQLY